MHRPPRRASFFPVYPCLRNFVLQGPAMLHTCVRQKRGQLVSRPSHCPQLDTLMFILGFSSSPSAFVPVTCRQPFSPHVPGSPDVLSPSLQPCPRPAHPLSPDCTAPFLEHGYDYHTLLDTCARKMRSIRLHMEHRHQKAVGRTLGRDRPVSAMEGEA